MSDSDPAYRRAHSIAFVSLILARSASSLTSSKKKSKPEWSAEKRGASRECGDGIGTAAGIGPGAIDELDAEDELNEVSEDRVEDAVLEDGEEGDE